MKPILFTSTSYTHTHTHARTDWPNRFFSSDRTSSVVLLRRLISNRRCVSRKHTRIKQSGWSQSAAPAPAPADGPAAWVRHAHTCCFHHHSSHANRPESPNETVGAVNRNNPKMLNEQIISGKLLLLIKMFLLTGFNLKRRRWWVTTGSAKHVWTESTCFNKYGVKISFSFLLPQKTIMNLSVGEE